MAPISLPEDFLAHGTACARLAKLQKDGRPTFQTPWDTLRPALLPTARHEAAHATAALVLGRLFTDCYLFLNLKEAVEVGSKTTRSKIKGGGQFAPCTPPSFLARLKGGPSAQDIEDARKDAIVRLAGDAISEASQEDMDGLEPLLRPLVCTEAEYRQRVEGLRVEAHALIAARMPVVEAVAAALIDHPKWVMNAKEIVAIGKQAGAKPYHLPPVAPAAYSFTF